MRSLFAAIAVTALAVLGVNAQEDDTRKISVSAYGTSGSGVLDEVAADLDADLHLGEGARGSIADWPLWLKCEDAPAADVLEVLGLQLGLRFTWDRAEGQLVAYEYGEPGGSPKGYDVSVLTGRYVDYINSYGADRQSVEQPKSAATRWAELVGETICSEAEISVVGDRVLITDVESNHERVREFLNLMVDEGGGESAELVTERQTIAKLKEAKVEIEVRQRPLASVFAEICDLAEVPSFMDPDVAHYYTDEHVDADFEGENAYDALRGLVAHHGVDRDVVGVFNGFVFSTYDRERLVHSYRVIDVSELLKKLDTAYKRQRTAENKQKGYQGSLRQDGGVDVIRSALVDQLEANGHSTMCRAYGSRLVVFGGSEVVDAALGILKEMGWESPETDDDE